MTEKQLTEPKQLLKKKSKVLPQNGNLDEIIPEITSFVKNKVNNANFPVIIRP